jgi:hypothetical protein
MWDFIDNFGIHVLEGEFTFLSHLQIVQAQKEELMNRVHNNNREHLPSRPLFGGI